MYDSEYADEDVELEEVNIETISVRRENLSNSPNDKKRRRIEVTGVVSSPVQRGRNWSEGDSLLLVEAYIWLEQNKKSEGAVYKSR